METARVEEICLPSVALRTAARNCGIADGLDNGRVQASALRDQAFQAAVGPLDASVGADGDDGVLHGVEQSLELTLAGLNGQEAFFELAGGFVEGRGYLADFVDRSCGDAGGEIAGGDPIGEGDDALQAAGGILRAHDREQHHDDESDTRSKEQGTMDAPGSGFDVGERIGEADGTSGDGGGDVEERNADGVAAAFVDADVSVEGSLEFLAGAMVFHGSGIGFRVGEHLAGGIDDGGASTGGQGFLRSDVLDRVLVIDFDAVGEQAGAGGEAALDLVAQGTFPDAADGDVHGDRGNNNDERRGREHLEEDAISHLGASKR